MGTANVFNKLGQSLMPKVAAAVFPDTLTVVAETTATDSGGARYKSATTNAYTSVPCAYEPAQIERRIEQGGKVLSSQQYIVTMPTHTAAGSRINLDPKTHRLTVAARGNEPAKTFRIIAVRDPMGVMFEVVCELEG